MTNTSKMPWLRKDYTATKRAFKKRLGLFDKDVAIEEQEEQAQMEDGAERLLIELDEQHERELEENYEETEIEQLYEEAEIERQIEEQEEAEIERQIEEQEEAEIERQIEEQEQEQYRIGKRWEDFSIAEIEKEYKQKNKGN